MEGGGGMGKGNEVFHGGNMRGSRHMYAMYHAI